MSVTVQNREDVARALRSLGVDIHDLLLRLPGHIVVLDRKQRTLAELGRETFGPRAGEVHDEANRRALQGEDVTYDWYLQKGRQQFRLSTTVSPLHNAASRIVGLLAVTRSLSAVPPPARQLLELERGVRHLTEVIESYRRPDAAFQLSSREHDVLRLLRAGYRPRSIAELLHVSPLTVRNHLKAMFKKTGTHSQEELITMSRRPADGS